MNAPPAAWLDDVDVAVVSHNGRQTLPGVLTSLAAAGVPADRITLYDIASTDETDAWAADAWPAVRRRRMAHNDGPNPARNRALADAERPYLLLIDSDGYLRPDAPAALRRAMAPDVGAAVPVVVHQGDPGRIQYAGSTLHFICEAITPWADRPVSERGGTDADIGTAPGVCFLLDVAVARGVGGFDERYFMGKEDGEFCFRLRAAGFRLVETPAAIAGHGSRPRSTWLYPFQIRNRWHFMLKNYERRTLLAIAPALLVHEPIQIAVLAAKGELRAYGTALVELRRMTRGLRADRRRAAGRRRIHDRDILAAAPLVVRADVAGSGLARALKRAYDRWLAGYWAIASLFLR